MPLFTAGQGGDIPQALIDAKGDLLAGTGADALTRVAVGTDGQVLTADAASAGGVKWATAASAGPAFRAYRTTSTQTIAINTFVKAQLNAETFDTDNCFDSTTNYRFTPTKAGYYMITAAYEQSDAAASRNLVVIYKNGAAYSRGNMNSSGYMDYGPTTTALVYCNGSTDYIEMYVWGNAQFNMQQGSAITYMTGVWIRS